MALDLQEKLPASMPPVAILARCRAAVRQTRLPCDMYAQARVSLERDL
jgi:hypothetical protein